MNSKLITKSALTLAIVLSFTGCEKDETQSKPHGKFSKGGIIVNEGGSSGNSSISFFNRDSMVVINDLFYKVNQRPLGTYAQSVAEFNNHYYLVVSSSNKIEIVNTTDFVSTGVIENMDKPRYFLGIDDKKAYVTLWGEDGTEGSVAVVDLLTNTVKKNISTGSGAEKMLKIGNIVFVCNAGGYGKDSTVAVINSVTDELVTKIKVGPSPRGIVLDKSNKIWVLCGGKWKSDWSGLETPGALICINPEDYTIEHRFDFTSLSTSAESSSLTINQAKDKLYYIYEGKVFEHNIANNTLENNAVINRKFYKVAVDPENNLLYATDPKDYSTNGWLIRYNNSFAKVDSFELSLVPGELYFN